jgi:hypothetical protein
VLKKAPGLDKKHWQEQVNMKWLGQSAEYFGFPVVWKAVEVVPESPVVGVEPPLHKH